MGTVDKKPAKGRNQYQEGELTPKMRHFARCVASGMSYADAYREAYDVSPTTKQTTIHPKASKLAAMDKVKARIELLLSLRDKAYIRSTADVRTKVLKKLEDFMEEALPSDSVRLKATELLGKTIGLFTDVVDDKRNVNRSSKELKDELLARLTEVLAEESADDKPTVN